MTYIQARISHRGLGDWQVYLPEHDDFVHGTSKPKAEYATYRYLEEAWGYRDFHIVWSEE
jgi:hypothetical protein